MTTDEQLASVLRGHYAGEPVKRAERERMTQVALREISSTRQGRHRLWPFSVDSVTTRGSWVPGREPTPAPSGHAPARGFTLISALKFVVAAAIVALFGGFLLMGVLATPQDGEMTPAAVTESPSPMTTEELLSGMVTEEVEPGVLRVVDDGVRDLSITPSDELSWPGGAGIIAGLDGSIWLGEGERMVRLGDEDSVELKFGDSGYFWGAEKEVVAADGTIWVVEDVLDSDSEFTGRRLWSYDGEKWDERATPMPKGLAAAPDGAIWVTWDDDLARFDAEGRGVIDLPAAQRWRADEQHGLAVTDDGDVWAWGGETPLYRYDGKTWQEVEMPDTAKDTAVGRDGTVWCTQRRWTGNVFDQPVYALYRLDGAGLQRLAVDSDSRAALSGALTQTSVTPDGRLWVWGLLRGDGVDLFDGDSRTHYLQGHGVFGWDMAPDGSVWVLAAKTDVDESPIHTYVITPEAVAASE